MRIVIPIGIVTRICEQLGWISHLGDLLGPLMQLVGLPGELGLVWATTMVLNIYAGVMVFATLSTGLELNVAQMTVIGTMMLVAHALPVELRVAQKIGTRFRIMLLLRVAGAFVLGALLNQIYRLSDTLQQPATTLWRPVAQDTGWLAWGLGQFKSMLMILVIIFSLMLLLKLCRKVGITALLTRLLEPLLTLLGMGREVAPLTIIGMTLGISYGGGLLIAEVAKGTLAKKDVFLSLALMGLCHSLIEDTLIVLLFGGHLSGILWGRILFALLMTFLFARLLRVLPQRVFERYLVRPTLADKLGQVKDDDLRCC